MTRNLIERRQPVLLCCEGPSEESYGGMLKQLIDDGKRDVHLDVVLLRPGGGDPLTLAIRAEKHLTKRTRGKRPPYRAAFLLLDSDLVGESPERDQLAREIMSKNKITPIWQEPCHEAFLLRHLPNCLNLRPPKMDAEKRLKAEWPKYHKPMPIPELLQCLGRTHLTQIATVHADLAAFLKVIGLA